MPGGTEEDGNNPVRIAGVGVPVDVRNLNFWTASRKRVSVNRLVLSLSSSPYC